MSLLRLITKKRRSRQFIARAKTAFHQPIALSRNARGKIARPLHRSTQVRRLNRSTEQHQPNTPTTKVIADPWRRWDFRSSPSARMYQPN
jgi:hypothetical protein